MSNVRAQVRRVLDETVASMSGLETPALAKMMPVLKAAQKEVEQDLRVWLREHSGETFTAARHKNALAVLNRAIHEAEIRAAIEHTLKDSSKRTIGPLALHNVQREWMTLGSIFEGTVQPLAFEEAAILAEGKRILWPRFESSARRYAGRVGDKARFELAVSRARGETVDELTMRLQKRLPHVFHGERWDAERLARTETMNASNEYHHQALLEARNDDPRLRERWDATHDGRLCVECASLDGQVADIDEDFVARSGARAPRPPIHPQDRCIVLPWRDTWPTYASKSSTETLIRAAEKAKKAA
jgi:SPP1 gp7 family putative phage head morphogenesis protein